MSGNKPVADLPAAIVDQLTVKPAPTPSNGHAPDGYKPGDGYGAAALATEAQRVMAAPNGERNHALNRSSFRMGRLVGAGVLDRASAERELTTAALAAGLGEIETEKTIKSGLDKGVLQPRVIEPRDTLPEPPEAPPFDDYAEMPAGPPAQAATFGDLPADGEFYSSQVFTPADALLPREVLPSIVRGIIRPGGLYMPFSSPKMLKSFLAMDLCQCVSMGLPWLPGVGHDRAAGFDVVQCPTLWIDQDNGTELMRERLAALARGYGVTDAPFYCLSFPTPCIAASRGLTALEKTAKHFAAGLVVFDNLLRIAGVRDENAAEVDLAMGNLRSFAEVTGAAVLVIHHRRKDASGREGDTIRGHSSIEASLDAAFLVTREDGGDVVTVKCTTARRKPVDTFGALFTYEPAADGETLHSARFYHAQPANRKQDAEQAIRDGILAALAGGPMKTNDLTPIVSGRRADILAMLAAMQQERAITVKAGQHGAKIYSLPL